MAADRRLTATLAVLELLTKVSLVEMALAQRVAWAVAAVVLVVLAQLVLQGGLVVLVYHHQLQVLQ